jgi:hypothetical protein
MGTLQETYSATDLSGKHILSSDSIESVLDGCLHGDDLAIMVRGVVDCNRDGRRVHLLIQNQYDRASLEEPFKPLKEILIECYGDEYALLTNMVNFIDNRD